MSGVVARPDLRTVGSHPAPSEELFAAGLSHSKPLPRGRFRGKSLVHGTPVQMAYATIDAVLAFAIGTGILWLRVVYPFVWSTELQMLGGAWQPYVGVFLLYSLLLVMCCASQDLYCTPRDRTFLDETVMVAKAVGLATSILVMFIFASGSKELSRIVIVSSGVLNLVALSCWRYFKRRLVLWRTSQGVGVSRVLVVGAGRTGKMFSEWLQRTPQLGYSVCGFLDEQTLDAQTIGKKIRHLALSQFVDELFITLPAPRDAVKAMVLEARRLRLGLKIVPDLYDGMGWLAPLHKLGGFPVIDMHWQPIPAVGLVLKRALDVLISGIALIFAVPIIALLAVLIRVDSRGPAIYASDRVGFKGKKFRCFKLRTMVADADRRKEKLRHANEREGPFFKIENDPRVTRLGRWLRKYSLDELPQFWNVLRGDMSLVGPRPHPLDDYERYSVEHLRRLDVNPGLTGLWQVTARNDPSFERNMVLDLEYIENWTLGLDLKLLIKTIPAVLRMQTS